MRRRRIIDSYAYDEAVDDARRWKAKAERYEAQALRLKRALDEAILDHHAELRKAHETNALVMHWNAGLALELSAARFELAQRTGEV